MGLERMLRMDVAQQCLGFSDAGIEDAIYDSQAIRRFVGIDLALKAAPDATTVLRFRRFLEQHDLTAQIFATINAHQAKRGLLLRQGTIVDATIMAAPSSTKNREGRRDPDMHQAKKGNQWHFVRNAHPASRDRRPSRRPAAACAAWWHEGPHRGGRRLWAGPYRCGHPGQCGRCHPSARAAHGQETDVFGDAGYQGVDKRDEVQRCHPNVNWHVAMRPGKRRALPATPWGGLMERIEQTEARIRAKAEHAFHVVKNLFDHEKTRCHGLEKNGKQSFTLFGWANRVLARRWLLVPEGIAPVAP